MKQDVLKHVIDCQTHKVEEVSQAIINEMPITIYVNDDVIDTLMCIPNELENLIIGYLFNAYMIMSKEDIKSIIIDYDKGLAYVEIEGVVRPVKERYITSGCATSAVYHNLEDAVRLRFNSLFTSSLALKELKGLFDDNQEAEFSRVSLSGDQLLTFRGLNLLNALDKLVGYMVSHHIDPSQKILSFGEPVTSEVILKAIRIGITVVVSQKSPTSNAIKLAEMHQVLLVEFEDNCINVYSEFDRILI